MAESRKGRIAPAEGYVAGPKRHYRHDIWATFRRLVMHRSDAHALLMPSTEGTEVDVAIAAGFREENLHLVDKNPAIAAHLKRRYRRAACYGVDIAQAASRITKAGIRLTVANLDLCGTTTGNGPTIAAFIDSMVMADRSAIGITVLRGRDRDMASLLATARGRDEHSPIAWMNDPNTGDVRAIESKLTKQGIPNATPGDHGRITWLSCLLQQIDPETLLERYFPTLQRCSSYQSNAGSQTMLWAIFSLPSPDAHLDDQCKQLPKQHREVARTIFFDLMRRSGHPELSPKVHAYVQNLRGGERVYAEKVLALASQTRRELWAVERIAGQYRSPWQARPLEIPKLGSPPD